MAPILRYREQNIRLDFNGPYPFLDPLAGKPSILVMGVSHLETLVYLEEFQA